MVDKSVKVNVAESMSRRQWSTDEFSAVLSAHTEMVSRFINSEINVYQKQIKVISITSEMV